MDMSDTSTHPLMEDGATTVQVAIALARADLRDRAVAAVPDVLSAVADLDLGDCMESHALIADLVEAVGAAFRQDPYSPAGYAAIRSIQPDHAAALFNILLQTTFGNETPNPATLTRGGALSFAATMSAAGAHAQALEMLDEATPQRDEPAVRHAAWKVRCARGACSERVEDYWAAPIPDYADAAEAKAAVAVRPYDVTARRAAIRFAMSAPEPEKASARLAVALALPIGVADKIALAEEVAMLAAVSAARNVSNLFDQDRLRWALGSVPDVADAAATLLDRQVAAGALPFLDAAEASGAVARLRGIATAGGSRAVTGYPMRNGKPHVDIVWLEITNHCNQKCTFCPDMFREDARTWLPLEQVKTLIDQLADTISVGSMQLNAYGEPLLHPNIAEILAYIRERQLPFPTFFTSHGMTLVDKKLKQLSHNYPAGIAISLHNDSQESYAATRSGKIGDYDTLVARVTALMKQMVEERAPSHLRLYQMVSNGAVDLRVDEMTRSAFPNSAERMIAHLRKWEAIAREIVAKSPIECQAQAPMSTDAYIALAFENASHGDREHLPILQWTDVNGVRQEVFVSARPVGTYANLLLEYDPRWAVERKVVNTARCGFVNAPSLAIFATGRLGICCLDLNSTATFGALSDYDDLHDALTSPEALRMFAQLSNGIATSTGCQVCLGGSERRCESLKLPRPTRPAGHFPAGV